MPLCVSVWVCLVVTCLESLTSWLSFVVSNREFVTFPIGILVQVRYLIVSIPDPCTLIYIDMTFCVHHSHQIECKTGLYKLELAVNQFFVHSFHLYLKTTHLE